MDSKGLSLHIDSGLGSLLIGVYSSGVEGGGDVVVVVETRTTSISKICCSCNDDSTLCALFM